MNQRDLAKALKTAVEAARGAGALMRKNFRSVKKANLVVQHDIKLELDVRCQKLIEKTLLKNFPEVAVLGEEGVSGDPSAQYRWVIDPIDGTVNYAYQIPHACVSIALQEFKGPTRVDAGYQTVVGVVLDPFCDELWTAIRGKPACLNDKAIHVSRRSKLAEAVISLGFSKQDAGLNKMLPKLQDLAFRVRKIRIMGAAALDLVYVASGRYDGYLESGLRLWDIAAGGLILECAGGEFWNEPLPGDHYFQIVANNGLLRKKLTAPLRH
jgi:myo-inositol-1(or 4)-monophosphatase